MILTTLALATLMVIPTANAQTVMCNPLRVETSCPPNSALSTDFAEDFKAPSKWFSAETFPERIKYGEEGLSVTLAQRYDNPAIKSNFYLMFGKLEVILKAAPGRGVVSSFYLQSDDLDEIDLEWIGSDNTEVQTNYFSKGNTTTYDRGEFHGVHEPQQTFHNYTIDWTNEALTWYLDGQVLRVLKNDSASGYPQTPMYVISGVWAGGDPDNAPGTIEWAGGLTDFTQAPFTMNVKKVVATDYSSGSEYSYSDKSGKWTSIVAKDGEVLGRLKQGAKEFDTSNEGPATDTYTHEESSTTQEQKESLSSYSSEEPEATEEQYYDDGISTSQTGIAYSSSGGSFYTRSLDNYTESKFFSSSSAPNITRNSSVQQSTSNAYSLKHAISLGYSVRAITMTFLLSVLVLCVI